MTRSKAQNIEIIASASGKICNENEGVNLLCPLNGGRSLPVEFIHHILPTIINY